MTTGHDHGQPVTQNTDSDVPLLDQLADYIATIQPNLGKRTFHQTRTGDTLTADVTAMTPKGQDLARDALEAWTMVSGIHFELVESAGADIRFSHTRDDGSIPNTAGVASLDSRGFTIYSAQVIVPERILNTASPFSVFLHEVGHALGLNHPGEYSKLYGLVFEDEAMFANDSRHTTVMSYFGQDDNPNIVQTVTAASPDTPQIADIIAIQLLYGKPAGANEGDTTYGVGANTGTYLDEVFAEWTSPTDRDTNHTVTIYDTHGFDTLDYSTDDTNQRIDLNPEGVSDVFTNASLGTIIIARDTIIERYVAGSGDDNVTGNIADNVLEGRDGDDTLMGGEGNDTLIGGPGADALGGDAGLDTASYAGSSTAVTVNLSDGTATGGDAEGDTFTSIENLTGSAFDDTLIGDTAENVLEGGDGADTLDGGGGADTASYAASDLAVSVDLSTGTNTGGHATGDTLAAMENLLGSRYADVFAGDAGANRLDGGAGNDRLEGRAGADTLVGGTGLDTASYAASAAAVTVNLETDAASGGDAAGDTLDSIEHLTGSAHDDTLIGDAGNNVLKGGAGADTLDGGEGIDTASYAGSASRVDVRLSGTVVNHGDATGDTLTNIENLIGSAHNDILVGNGQANALTGRDGNDLLWASSGDDHLTGGPGADRLVGGAGNDTASYAGSPDGVTVRLHSLKASGGDAQGDSFPYTVDVAWMDAGGAEQTETLPDVENLIGSAHDDILAGDRRDNDLDGGAGNDTLYGGPGGGDDVMAGGLGNDRLFGGQGDDTLIGGPGDDRLAGGAGADTLNGDAGTDTLDGGAGTDTADYTDSDASVMVNLSTGSVSGGYAAGDILSNIENVVGSRHDDALSGDAGPNRLAGGPGHDRLEGGPGADTLSGGPGNDVAVYAGSAAAVTVNLGTSAATGGDAAGDIFESVEDLIGSAHDDTLTGDAGNNVLTGREGADHLDGGDGIDTADYSDADTGITVSLQSGQGARGHAEGDTLVNIEHLTGSGFGDILTGDEGDNFISGGAGNDTLAGGQGADYLDGGEGIDTASYAGSGSKVDVRLSGTVVNHGDATGDTLTNIENLVGSAHNDILDGDRHDNVIDGGPGNDSLNGVQGDDELIGGAGNDTLYGGQGGGDDVMAGGPGNDRLSGGYGNDTLIGGQGDDRLAGGPGADVFVFGPGDGADTVTDFSSGTDKVDLTAFEIESVEDVVMTAGDDGVTIDLTDVDGGTVLLADLPTLPEAGDFLV